MAVTATQLSRSGMRGLTCMPVTVICAESRISTSEAPIKMSNAPGSTVHSREDESKYANARGGSVKESERFSPGASQT